MKAKSRHFGSLWIYIFAFVAALFVFFSIPLVSHAQTGTLGTESPEIFCVYEKDGVEYDGNNLSAGTYDVSFVMSGVDTLSVIEVTATYNQEQISVEPAPSELISDSAALGLDSMGYILSDGNIVFGFVSENDNCSSVVDNRYIVLAKISMTFSSDCDAQNYLKVSQNPNLTFAQVDYGDGYDDSYALVESSPDYTAGTLYLMTCDETPNLGYNVSGNLLIMTNASGTTNGVAPYGEYTINVYSDESHTQLVKSVKSVQSINADTNQRENTFNIESLQRGTYYATVSYDYALTRDIKIVVLSNDIKNAQITVLNCNFDGDTAIGVGDATQVLSNLNNSAYPYMDMDGDSNVGVGDATLVLSLLNCKYNKTLVIE